MTATQTTQESLNRLGRSVSAMLLAVAAFWFALLPPEGDRTAGGGGMILCGLGAAGLWWLGRRAAGPGTRIGPLIPLAVVVFLGLFQVRAGFEGWWPQTASAALGALIALGASAPMPQSAIGMAVTVAGVGWPSVASGPTAESSPGLTGYRILQLLIVYLVSLAAATALRASARRSDLTDDQARRRQERRIVAESESVAADAIRRVVHDTVLNTLEAVANGVGADRWEQLRQRCRSDLYALQHLGDVSGSHLVTDLAESARHLGLEVEVDDQWHTDPPELVTEALVGAAREALLNVAKHSGVSAATVRTRVDSDTAWIEVTDSGVGFAQQQSDRIGLQTAVMSTMQDVGGFAVVDSVPGHGTRVSLTWDVGRSRALAALTTLRTRMLWFAGGLAAAALLIWALLIGADTGVVAREAHWWTLLVAAGACVLLLVGSHQGPPPAPVLLVALGCLAFVTLMLPLGDPYCASFQRDSALDPRLVLLLCLAIVAVSWVRLAAAATVTILTSVVATLLVMRLSTSCGWGFAMSALVGCGVALGAFLFAGTLRDQEVLLDRQALAREQAFSAQVQRRVRSRELAQWRSAELARAADLLRDIVAGADDSEQLRQRARRCAQRVRRWLMLLGRTGPVNLVLQEWATGAGPLLELVGDPAAVDQDTAEALDAARRLRAWLPGDPAARLSVTVSRTAGTASVLGHSDQPARGEDPEAWIDEDGWWLHLTWPGDDR